MIALFLSLALAGPAGCDALVAHTVSAARSVAPADAAVEPILEAFAAEQAAACARGWTPAPPVRACIVNAREPGEVFACDGDLYDDLVGLWAAAGAVAVARR